MISYVGRSKGSLLKCQEPLVRVRVLGKDLRIIENNPLTLIVVLNADTKE
jgi:hypothetical protein